MTSRPDVPKPRCHHGAVHSWTFDKRPCLRGISIPFDVSSFHMSGLSTLLKYIHVLSDEVNLNSVRLDSAWHICHRRVSGWNHGMFDWSIN